MSWLTVACSIALALAGEAEPALEPRLRIETSSVIGLGPEVGVARRDPSDVIQVGEFHLVLYTRLDADTPLYPAPYAGEIWYATSTDGGRSWEERGRLLGRGTSGAFDSVGVFEPNVLRGADGSLWLFHSGTGPSFNFRFENVRRIEPVRIGLARLFVNVVSGEARAERFGAGAPILEPSERAGRGFDSLRVGGPAPVLRNGLVHLYYRARQFGQDGATSALGLALADAVGGPYERRHEGRAVLPFSGDVLLAPWRGGVLALLTTRQRGLFWAPDGEHFARMPVRLSGRLRNPGAAREGDAVGAEAGDVLWGLHEGGGRGDPFLERFELQLSESLPLPPRSVRAVPSSVQAEHWEGRTNWLGQHRAILEDGAERPRDFVLLGDGLTEGFGGHARAGAAPGQAAWERLFAGKEVQNLGVAGDGTQHLLWRLDHGALERARCRGVVLQIGGENLGRDEPEEIALGVESILRRVLHELLFSEVILVSLVPDPRAGPELWAATQECNRALEHLGRWPRVTYLDLAARLVDGSGRPRPELFEAERSALSVQGYEEWASALGPLLERIEAPVPEGAAEKLGELDRER